MKTEKRIQIYVRRGEERLGPFSWEEIRSKLESGEFEPREPAWHAALSGWSTLGTVLNAEADRLLPKHSHAGIGSAVIAGINMVIALIFPILYILPKPVDASWLSIALGVMTVLAFFGVIGLSGAGVMLGIKGCLERESKRGWAQTGLVVNGLILLIIVGIFSFAAYKIPR